MQNNETLHICRLDKFIPPFIDLVKENFSFSKHAFLLFGNLQTFPTKLDKNVIHINHAYQIFELILRMNQSRKIILHSLFNPIVVLLLFLQPWLLKKCYWIMWGGDLYYYKHRPINFKTNIYEKLRAFVIKRIGNLVTQVYGDVELARMWYQAAGKHHDSFVYPSNLYKEPISHGKKSKTINILAGNSAAPSNNHEYIFNQLSIYTNNDIRIYCPLSYGNQENAKIVATNGKHLFGDKFIGLFDLMPLDNYLELLAEIDIAIFAHDRQQGLGNTVSLLGLGKKVYLSRTTTSWSFFKKLDLKFFNVSDVSLEPISREDAMINKKIISDFFSKENLVKQLESIFK